MLPKWWWYHTQRWVTCYTIYYDTIGGGKIAQENN